MIGATLTLTRLVCVGIHANGDVFGDVAGPGEFAPQQFGSIYLGEEPGFKIKARRQAEIAVRGPREAINAAHCYGDPFCSQMSDFFFRYMDLGYDFRL